MQTERGWLVGPGDKALACDVAGIVTFSSTDLMDADVLEATPQADGRCVIRPIHHAALALGADATKYSPVGVCGQYYGTANAPGNYELWSFGQWPSGIVQACIEYTSQGADHGRAWQAAGLTWVKQQ
jgi:hypothetical protein